MKFKLMIESEFNSKRDATIQPVYVRIYHEQVRKYISTGISVARQNWNKSTQQATGPYAKYNNLLSAIVTNLNESYRELLLERDKEITSQALKDRYNGKDAVNMKYLDYARDRQEYLKAVKIKKDKEGNPLKSQLKYWG